MESSLSFLCATLLIVFIILKMTGAVAWPWVVVFLPLIVPCAGVLAFVAIMVGLFVVDMFRASRRD